MKKIIPNGSNLIPSDAKRVFDGIIFDVYQWEQELYDKTHATFEMLKRPDTTSVFAVVDDRVLILMIQDEQPHRDIVLGLPGGRVDPEDDTVLQAAQRELLEETGYSFNNWRLVWVSKPEEKIEWFVYTYLAWGVSNQTKPDPGAGEKITLASKSFAEIKELERAGEERLRKQPILEQCHTLEEFLATPEFSGQIVDR